MKYCMKGPPRGDAYRPAHYTRPYSEHLILAISDIVKGLPTGFPKIAGVQCAHVLAA